MSESYFLRSERLGLRMLEEEVRRNALHGSMIRK